MGGRAYVKHTETSSCYLGWLTHHSLAADRDSPAVQDTAAGVGNPAVEGDPAGRPPAAGHTGNFLQGATEDNSA